MRYAPSVLTSILLGYFLHATRTGERAGLAPQHILLHWLIGNTPNAPADSVNLIYVVDIPTKTSTYASWDVNTDNIDTSLNSARHQRVPKPRGSGKNYSYCYCRLHRK